MKGFDYDSYMRNNPLVKETSGYGNYTKPETMLEKDDYVSDEEFDTMSDDELDSAEETGDINSSDAPLGPDEELMEEQEYDVAIELGKGIDSLRDSAMYAHMAAEESGDTQWTMALDRIASILDQLEDYVNIKSRKLGVIKKR
jgi:hypothetical protein